MKRSLIFALVTLALVVGANCSSLPAKQKAVTSLASVQNSLEVLQDAERRLCNPVSFDADATKPGVNGAVEAGAFAENESSRGAFGVCVKAPPSFGVPEVISAGITLTATGPGTSMNRSRPRGCSGIRGAWAPAGTAFESGRYASVIHSAPGFSEGFAGFAGVLGSPGDGGGTAGPVIGG